MVSLRLIWDLLNLVQNVQKLNFNINNSLPLLLDFSSLSWQEDYIHSTQPTLVPKNISVKESGNQRRGSNKLDTLFYDYERIRTVELLSKNNEDWGCSLVVEHLSSISRALGLIPKIDGRKEENGS